MARLTGSRACCCSAFTPSWRYFSISCPRHPRKASQQLARGDSNALRHKPLGMLLQNTVVLHHLKPSLPGAVRSFLIANALLHPDHLRSFADGSVHHLGDELRATENDHHLEWL